MTDQQTPKKGLSVRMFILILASISIFMAVITIRTRNKIETIQKEHMLHPQSDKPAAEPDSGKPASPIGKPQSFLIRTTSGGEIAANTPVRAEALIELLQPCQALTLSVRNMGELALNRIETVSDCANPVVRFQARLGQGQQGDAVIDVSYRTPDGRLFTGSKSIPFTSKTRNHTAHASARKIELEGGREILAVVLD